MLFHQHQKMAFGKPPWLRKQPCHAYQGHLYHFQVNHVFPLGRLGNQASPQHRYQAGGFLPQNLLPGLAFLLWLLADLNHSLIIHNQGKTEFVMATEVD